MIRTSRRIWAGWLVTAGLGAFALVGCSGSGGHDGGQEPLGRMSLPLTTQGASGATYRLRNATFVVQRQYYYYEGGEAGSSSTPGTVTVSSETDPSATNISLSLEEGYYNVQLLSGWSMEKSTPSGAEAVEATLLSGADQWVYVSRQYTSWAEYSFGIGGRELWLNGKLNIGIDVQETPPGAGGDSGLARSGIAGGSPSVPTAAGAGGFSG